MDWFGKSSKVEGQNELESLGIRFGPILFHSDRNEYEMKIQLPDCPQNLARLTYDKQSEKLKLEGKKQKIEFVHQFSVPSDCSVPGIYGRFQGDVLYIIMPRLLSERPATGEASSKQEEDQKASSDREPTEQVREDREKLPARIPEQSSFDQKSTDKLTEGGGNDSGKLPARDPEPSSFDKKSTDKLTKGGRKDREKLPARGLSLQQPPSDGETTEKLRQRDNELFPEISAPQSSLREKSRSVKDLRENYQKNITKTPPPPPPTPPAAVQAPWNREKTRSLSRKEEAEDRRPSSNHKKTEQGDVKPENSIIKSQKKESKLGQEGAKTKKIVGTEEIDIESEKSDVKTQKKEQSKSGQEDAKNEKVVTGSKANEESKEKKPSGDQKGASGLVAKVKETGKAAVAAALKEENRPLVMIGAAVLALLVIGTSLRSSSRKAKN